MPTSAFDRLGTTVAGTVGIEVRQDRRLPLPQSPAQPGDIIRADLLVEAGARWARWVEETYPGSQILTEQPIAWRNALHQVMEGWIDTRIMLADGGHVLVDHKSYPGVDPVGHVRENYVGQLAAYAAALEATTGEWPREILVHLPLRGEVVGIGVRKNALGRQASSVRSESREEPMQKCVVRHD